MTEIDIKGFGRLGQDWRGGNLWLEDTEKQFGETIIKEILEQIQLSPETAHKITCGRINLQARSITGSSSLSRKVIKYRIKGDLKITAELVDDFEVDEETWKKLELRRNFGYWVHPEVYDFYFLEK